MPRLSKLGAAALAAFGWTSGVSAVTVTYLVVAGGGGGGSATATGTGGGGGAGGYLTGTLTLNSALSYTVTIGAGGVGGSSNGSDSVFSTITSIGGGRGGNWNTSPGQNGGSGGGGAGGGGGTTNLAAGTGTAGQGNNGGAGSTSNAPAGGGGGAGAAGTAGTLSTAGSGGNGLQSSISGTATYYAGGSAGGAAGAAAGSAGLGGGSLTNGNGTANTGGSGGGASPGNPGGKGGSGIVIISYAGAQQFGGGVITTDGTNTIHTFTTSGTLVPVTPLSASYLVVAGGGSGASGSGGGGGAGGYRTSSGIIDTNSTYLVTVGAGGAATAYGYGSATPSGTNSSFLDITSAGGGGGTAGQNGGGTTNGAAGGSGGGGGYNGTGGAGNTPSTSPSQGNNGGNASGAASEYPSGGGGGASAAGGSFSGSTPGNGGAGTASSISGTSVTYAGGGGGSATSTAGSGGAGGGGAGASGTSSATSGTANTGGGGGGARNSANSASVFGGAGGSGIVIISYPGSTQQMAGGTVTITGGNVIHTFTSSGYLAPLKYVNNSLRFRSSASASLTRTMSASGTTDSWSMWVKRGKLGTAQALFDYSNSSTTSFGIEFTSGDALTLYSYSSGFVLNLITSAVYRDPAAWYHIMCVIDTTQATSTNRARIYVNGVQVTSFSTATYPAQNTSLNIANSVTYGIGVTGTANSQYFDGYMAEINFIDGQALTPNSFGTINSYGVWQPITYGGSYGTNGFYLPFTNKTSTTTLGYDFSPNGNNWTPSAGISLTAGATYDSMTDVPTLTSATAANYAVLNPLAYGSTGTSIISNGNLSFSNPSAHASTTSTIGVTSGKYYLECTVTTSNPLGLGITTSTVPYSAYPGTVTGLWWVYDNTGTFSINNQTSTSYSGASKVALNQIWQIALDMDNGKAWFGINNTWYDSTGGTTGNPSTGANATFSSLPTSSPMFFFLETAGVAWAATFGQRPFTYTPPTGFVALNTYNL